MRLHDIRQTFLNYFESNQHWQIVIAGSAEVFEEMIDTAVSKKLLEDLQSKARQGELSIHWQDDKSRVVNIIISPTTN